MYIEPPFDVLARPAYAGKIPAPYALFAGANQYTSRAILKFRPSPNCSRSVEREFSGKPTTKRERKGASDEKHARGKATTFVPRVVRSGLKDKSAQ
jgi:hypothetical protein